MIEFFLIILGRLCCSIFYHFGQIVLHFFFVFEHLVMAISVFDIHEWEMEYEGRMLITEL